MSKSVTPQTQYAQYEPPYLYCSLCGRKDYRVKHAGQRCNASFNVPSSSTSKAYCSGVLTLSTAIPAGSFSTPHDAHDNFATS